MEGDLRGDQPQFDPELEELLREIAADPDSTLLRVPRNKAREAAARFEPAVSSGTALLTLAERELLTVHRCETARLLRQALLMRRHAAPEHDLYMHTSVTLDSDLEIPAAADWRVRREDLPRIDDERCLSGYELLERCTGEALEQWPDDQQLGAAALRLHPTGEVRIDLALVAIDSGDASGGATALRAMLARPGPPMLVSYAWENLGYAHGRLGERRESLEAYRRACAIGDFRPIPVLLAALYSLLVGDRVQAEHASRIVDERVPADHSSLQWLLRVEHVRRQQGEWCVTDEVRQLANALTERCGTTSRRLLDALRT